MLSFYRFIDSLYTQKTQIIQANTRFKKELNKSIDLPKEISDMIIDYWGRSTGFGEFLSMKPNKESASMTDWHIAEVLLPEEEMVWQHENLIVDLNKYLDFSPIESMKLWEFQILSGLKPLLPVEF